MKMIEVGYEEEKAKLRKRVDKKLDRMFDRLDDYLTNEILIIIDIEKESI